MLKKYTYNITFNLMCKTILSSYSSYVVTPVPPKLAILDLSNLLNLVSSGRQEFAFFLLTACLPKKNAHLEQPVCPSKN